MVRRVIGLVYSEIKGLHKAAYILAIFALTSQILALVRDRLLASEFGAGATLDIYYAAFRIPDLLFVLFASTLSVYVLIPFVTRFHAASDDAGARTLLSQIATLFLAAYSALAVLVIVFAPWLMNLIFPSIADQATLVTVLRVLMLQPLFLGLSSLCGVVTQIAHRFIIYALSPLIYNLGIILGIGLLYPLFGLPGLAIGVVLGAIGHFAIQWPLVVRSPYAFGLTTSFDWPALWRVLCVSVPRALTLSLQQIVLLVLISIASAMAVGSVAVFQFAYNLQSVPLAIIGVSYSVAAFPTLARLFSADEMDSFRVHILTALRHVIFWSVPVIVLCVVLRAQLVRVILGSGLFNWEDTRLTAAVFGLLVVSLLFQAINLLLIRAFYAGGNTHVPLVITIVSSAAAIGLAQLFLFLYTAHPAWQQLVAHSLRVSDVVGTEIITIAAAYSAAMIFQSVILLVWAARLYKLSLWSLRYSIRNAVLSATLGGSAAYAALQFFVAGLNTNTFVGIFLQGSLAGIFGLVGVLLGYAALRSPELHEVSRSISRKLFKTDIIAQQKDVL